jgi:NADP-dependent 3-hydroxy acid dehydrogenase YdfG
VAAELKNLGVKSLAVCLDITDYEAVKVTVTNILQMFGKIDILINCAGAGWRNVKPFDNMQPDDWKWILDLNINGTLNFINVVLENMKEHQYGRIINLSSISAAVGIPTLKIYSATNWVVKYCFSSIFLVRCVYLL